MKLCACNCGRPLSSLSGRGLYRPLCYQRVQRQRDRERYEDISAAEIEARYQAARAQQQWARRREA